MILKFKLEQYKKWLMLVAGVITLTFAYSVNIFDITNNEKSITYFPRFQKDSENLVITSVMAQNYADIQIEPYGLGMLADNDNDQLVYVDEEVDLAKQMFNEKSNKTTKPYKSSVGFQGHVINFFHRLGLKNFSIFRLTNAFLMAVVLVGICCMIYKKYDSLLAGIFFVVFALSPWLTAFARNLYWVGFLWFLPLLLVFIYQQVKNRKQYQGWIFLFLIGLTIFIKSLCGYEYISSIMIITVFPVIIDFFQAKKRSSKIEVVKTFLKISIVMIAGFLLAFAVHATLRGNGNLVDGIKDIYKNDVKRRMAVGDYDSEKSIVNDSKHISTIEVLKTYINFNTPVLTGLIGASSFTLILVASFLFLVSDLINDYRKIKIDLIMWLVMLVAPLSWYILAKPHSYVHTHMNYVLWYFGFIQIALYVIIKRVILFIKNFKGEKERYADFSW